MLPRELSRLSLPWPAPNQCFFLGARFSVLRHSRGWDVEDSCFAGCALKELKSVYDDGLCVAGFEDQTRWAAAPLTGPLHHYLIDERLFRLGNPQT